MFNFPARVENETAMRSAAALHRLHEHSIKSHRAVLAVPTSGEPARLDPSLPRGFGAESVAQRIDRTTLRIHSRRPRSAYAESVVQRSPGLADQVGQPWERAPLPNRTLKEFRSPAPSLAAPPIPRAHWNRSAPHAGLAKRRAHRRRPRAATCPLSPLSLFTFAFGGLTRLRSVASNTKGRQTVGRRVEHFA